MSYHFAHGRTPAPIRTKRREKQHRAHGTGHSCDICGHCLQIIRDWHYRLLVDVRRYGTVYFDRLIEFERDINYHNKRNMEREACRAKRPLKWYPKKTPM